MNTPYRRITHCQPSHVAVTTRATHGGGITATFAPTGDTPILAEYVHPHALETVFGSAESWIAHQLLGHCAGCHREGEGTRV